MDLFAPHTDATLDPFVLAGLAAAVVGLGLGLWLRRELRLAPLDDPEDQVFHADLATALTAWASAQAMASLGWALRVGGLSMPVWSDLVLASGVLTAGLAWWRWRRALWRVAGLRPLDADAYRADSQTWEYALIPAGLGLLTGYVLGIQLGFHQPIHMLVAVDLALAGYALGLVLWSPKVLVHRRHPASTNR